MKLIFANRNYSSWSLRAWLVLKHFGIAFDEDLVLLSGDMPLEVLAGMAREWDGGRLP